MSNRILKEYKTISERTIEQLAADLNAHGDEGWSVVLSIQEFGCTKILMERLKESN